MLFREPLEAYSFDYSSHKSPLAYKSYQSAVELMHKTKLIPAVKNTYGAFFLKKVSISSRKLNNTLIFHV